MDKSCWVSVIIPCYNQARFVPQAVASALAQTHKQVEVIVVDDGSTDDTETALASYIERIHFIHQENAGLPAARNAGFRVAKGDYILFLDSDDWIDPETVAHHVAVLESHPDYALTYSAWQQVSEDGTQILGTVRPGQQDNILKSLLRREFFFFASAATLRRECLASGGLFDESLSWGEDADLWLRLARAGFTFGYIDLPFMRYRVHANSMTAKVHPEQIEGWQAVLDKFFADVHLPDDVVALKPEAYSILHFETAGRYARAGMIAPSQHHIQEAIRLNPAIDENWLLEWIAGTALDPRTSDPSELIDLLTQNEALSGLRRRGRARYHMAAAFAAYRDRNHQGSRQHILPALIADPTIISNKGFLKIAFESLVK